MSNVNVKEKALFPDIVVRKIGDKPYYEIKYYDVTDNEWHIGYGSYNLDYVMQWKEEVFEVADGCITDVEWKRILDKLQGAEAFHNKSISIETSKQIKSEVVEEIIGTIERELDKATNNGDYICEDGTTIETDVGYVYEWFDEYKEILRKKYCGAGMDGSK